MPRSSSAISMSMRHCACSTATRRSASCTSTATGLPRVASLFPLPTANHHQLRSAYESRNSSEPAGAGALVRRRRAAGGRYLIAILYDREQLAREGSPIDAEWGRSRVHVYQRAPRRSRWRRSRCCAMRLAWRRADQACRWTRAAYRRAGRILGARTPTGADQPVRSAHLRRANTSATSGSVLSTPAASSTRPTERRRSPGREIGDQQGQPRAQHAAGGGNQSDFGKREFRLSSWQHPPSRSGAGDQGRVAVLRQQCAFAHCCVVAVRCFRRPGFQAVK